MGLACRLDKIELSWQLFADHLIVKQENQSSEPHTDLHRDALQDTPRARESNFPPVSRAVGPVQCRKQSPHCGTPHFWALGGRSETRVAAQSATDRTQQWSRSSGPPAEPALFSQPSGGQWIAPTMSNDFPTLPNGWPPVALPRPKLNDSAVFSLALSFPLCFR